MNFKDFWIISAIAVTSILPPKTSLVAQGTQPQMYEALSVTQDPEKNPTPKDGEIQDGQLFFPTLWFKLDLARAKKLDSLSQATVNMTQQHFDTIIALIGIERTIEIFSPKTPSEFNMKHSIKFLVRNSETGKLEYREFRSVDRLHDGVEQREDGSYRTVTTDYNPPKFETSKREVLENDPIDFARQHVVSIPVRPIVVTF